MTPRVVLDTSVVLKWFRQGEVLAQNALALRTAYVEGQIDLSLPTFLAYEVANVLRYKNDLATPQVQEALQSLFDMGWEWVAPTAGAVQRAVAIARESDVTVYDAIFAAVAETLGAVFITADERLARRLNGLPFVHYLGDDRWGDLLPS